MNSTNTSQTEAIPAGESEPSGSGGIAGAKQRIKVTARETVEQVKNATASTVNRAKEETGKIVSDKRRVAAEKIGGYSSAIHDSAKSLEGKDPNIAWFTHRAADRLQTVADYVRDRDMTDLRHDAEDVARRHPAVFFGGLFVAGLLIGNLLKASGGTRENEPGSRQFSGNSDETQGIVAMGQSAEGRFQGSDRDSDDARGSGIENQVTT
ncbi:MAG: hypothetical protein ABIO94_09840 [Opitutaceae bacterium]